MKTGIIGLPQVGKTSLFKILTKVDVEDRAYNPREAHLGVAKVPDQRLDKLSALYNPKKLVHASVEYADVAAIGQEALKESGMGTGGSRRITRWLGNSRRGQAWCVGRAARDRQRRSRACLAGAGAGP